MSEEQKVKYEDFKKLDIRIGQIVEAENIPKSRHLLKLKVDIGEGEPRQILAGLSQYYEPEKLKGRKVVVLANLQPRKLMGFDSNGMILAADVDDKPFLLKIPDKFSDDIPTGTKVL